MDFSNPQEAHERKLDPSPVSSVSPSATSSSAPISNRQSPTKTMSSSTRSNTKRRVKKKLEVEKTLPKNSIRGSSRRVGRGVTSRTRSKCSARNNSGGSNKPKRRAKRRSDLQAKAQHIPAPADTPVGVGMRVPLSPQTSFRIVDGRLTGPQENSAKYQRLSQRLSQVEDDREGADHADHMQDHSHSVDSTEAETSSTSQQERRLSQSGHSASFASQSYDEPPKPKKQPQHAHQSPSKPKRQRSQAQIHEFQRLQKKQEEQYIRMEKVRSRRNLLIQDAQDVQDSLDNYDRTVQQNTKYGFTTPNPNHPHNTNKPVPPRRRSTPDYDLESTQQQQQLEDTERTDDLMVEDSTDYLSTDNDNDGSKGDKSMTFEQLQQDHECEKFLKTIMPLEESQPPPSQQQSSPQQQQAKKNGRPSLTRQPSNDSTLSSIKLADLQDDAIKSFNDDIDDEDDDDSDDDDDHPVPKLISFGADIRQNRIMNAMQDSEITLPAKLMPKVVPPKPKESKPSPSVSKENVNVTPVNVDTTVASTANNNVNINSDSRWEAEPHTMPTTPTAPAVTATATAATATTTDKKQPNGAIIDQGRIYFNRPVPAILKATEDERWAVHPRTVYGKPKTEKAIQPPPQVNANAKPTANTRWTQGEKSFPRNVSRWAAQPKKKRVAADKSRMPKRVLSNDNMVLTDTNNNNNNNNNAPQRQVSKEINNTGTPRRGRRRRRSLEEQKTSPDAVVVGGGEEPTTTEPSKVLKRNASLGQVKRFMSATKIQALFRMYQQRYFYKIALQQERKAAIEQNLQLELLQIQETLRLRQESLKAQLVLDAKANEKKEQVSQDELIDTLQREVKELEKTRRKLSGNNDKLKAANARTEQNNVTRQAAVQEVRERLTKLQQIQTKLNGVRENFQNEFQKSQERVDETTAKFRREQVLHERILTCMREVVNMVRPHLTKENPTLLNELEALVPIVCLM